MADTPARNYRESDELYDEVTAAVAYFGTTVSADIVAHHKKLVKRWKEATKQSVLSDAEFEAEARRRGHVQRANTPPGTFRAWVQREDHWWIIRIPAIDGITQARNKREVERMAKDLVAITLDIPVETVKIELLRGIPE